MSKNTSQEQQSEEHEAAYLFVLALIGEAAKSMDSTYYAQLDQELIENPSLKKIINNHIEQKPIQWQKFIYEIQKNNGAFLLLAILEVNNDYIKKWALNSIEIINEVRVIPYILNKAKYEATLPAIRGSEEATAKYNYLYGLISCLNTLTQKQVSPNEREEIKDIIRRGLSIWKQ